MSATLPPIELSIIIPVLNELNNLRSTLTALPFGQDSGPSIEVILCDGGSTDNTLDITKEFPVKVLSTEPPRAGQMNEAARYASGDVLLFLHADTTLPPHACEAIIRGVSQGFSMGCFEREFTSRSRLLKITSRLAGWRARKTFWVYGDQAIFMRRALFDQLGGYRNKARFEDIDLAIRAKKHGSWLIIPDPVLTSARRFGSSTRSRFTRVVHDFLLTLAWLTGIIRS